MGEFAPLINAGAAGAIIAVVILFLRFIRDQRADDREERMSERKLWTGALEAQQVQAAAHNERITKSLDQLAEKIARCPTNTERTRQ